MASQPHGLHYPAVVSLIFPDQQIGDSARIVEIASHKPRRDDGHALAVESRPETEEVPVPSVPLFFSRVSDVRTIESSRILERAMEIEPTSEAWEGCDPNSLFFNRAFWVLWLSPFFWSIHTPHFRSRIGCLNSTRFIGLSFASSRHLC